MTTKKILQSSLLSVSILLGTITSGFAQNNAAAFAAADSSKFSINTSGGWQLYNSYLTQFKPDSVQVELIIQHENINLQQEQYIGNIKYIPFRPAVEQTVSFNLLQDRYTLRIETMGKCYLRFISGTLPVGNPMVLPLKVYYKLH